MSQSVTQQGSAHTPLILRLVDTKTYLSSTVRRYVDNMTRTPSHHFWKYSSHTVEDSVNVHAHHLVPALQVTLPEVLIVHDTCIVDQHINRADSILNVLNASNHLDRVVILKRRQFVN